LSNYLKILGKMSAKVLRIVAVFIVVLAFVSTVSAARLEAVGRNQGYGPKLENLRKRVTEDAKAKPQPVRERAAAATTASTPTSP
jgi:carboxypeptidase D